MGPALPASSWGCVLVSVSGAIEIVINVSIILDAKENFLPLGYAQKSKVI